MAPLGRNFRVAGGR